jgi:peptide/nickel transport system substrate-binding protein
LRSAKLTASAGLTQQPGRFRAPSSLSRRVAAPAGSACSSAGPEPLGRAPRAFALEAGDRLAHRALGVVGPTEIAKNLRVRLPQLPLQPEHVRLLGELDCTRGALRSGCLAAAGADPRQHRLLTVLGFSAPVPPGIPDRDLTSATLPGTGPYTIVHAGAREVRFERNRFFHEWSHAAQPDGNPDTVVWRVLPSLSDAVDAVAQGRADWMLGLIPPDRLRRLRLSRPAQLHVAPALGVLFAPLNSHIAPFDDVRVRRALNYAIDRGRIVRMYGGRAVATPLCQTLASGMPGYRRYCPYTAAPRHDGLWTAPDLPRARRLVAASGTRSALVDVWGTNDSTFTTRELPHYFASVLRSLGYRARLHIVSYTALTPSVRRRIQLSVDGDWAPDYPAPSSYLPEFFGCGGSTGNGYVCDRAIDRRMQRASTLELRDPTAAAAAWARIDRALADGAYWVPTVSLRAQELTSKRVRNYQYNPVWGFVADQVWLR